jgi:membrane protease YdiL (CAAX protease family)
VSDVPLQPTPDRGDVLAALSSAPLFVALWRTLGTADRFPRIYGEGGADALEGLAPWLWQFGTFFCLFLVLPLAHVALRRYSLPQGPSWRRADVVPLAGEPWTPASPRAIGWGVPASRRVWLWTLLACALAVVVAWRSAAVPEVRAEYPMFRGLLHRPSQVLPYEAAYVLLYYVAFESYFRGYLLFTAAPRIGNLEAVVVQSTTACLLHLGKPDAELLLSFPFSVALGLVALRTRSFWPGLLVHVALGVSTDLFSIHA